MNRSILKQALNAKADCLTPKELEKLAADATASNPHVAECAHCESELAMLKMFESSEPLPGEGAAVAWISARLEQRLEKIKNPRKVAKSSAQSSSWFGKLFSTAGTRWLLPVAAILVVGATSIFLMQRSQEPKLRADAGDGPAIYRSLEVTVIAPSGELAEAPKTLQWKGLPGAVSYKVAVTEVDESPLWAAETKASDVTIPDAIRGRMLPGKPVLWKVTALDSQGRVLAVSQVQHLSVQRKSPSATSGVLSR